MRLSARFRFRTTLPLAAFLLLPLAQAQTAPAAATTSAAAPAVDLPAAAGSAGNPASSSTDQVDLNDIRNFSRVYEIVRQAYVEKVDNKTLMKAAITGMLSGLDPHSEYLDKNGLAQLSEDTTGQY
ncbi:MAG TPA: peptidase S41, partial [Rhodanobacter sp.]|nr:peptidase S41 [Rhodanobacter sp.]